MDMFDHHPHTQVRRKRKKSRNDVTEIRKDCTNCRIFTVKRLFFFKDTEAVSLLKINRLFAN